MNINTILGVFTPKDTTFIPMLQEAAVILAEASVLLDRLFSAKEEDRRELCRLIKEQEVKGDYTTGGIFKALNQTFITPFDREDIHALADQLDDVIDAVNRSAQKVDLYSPKQLPAHTAQLAGIVRQGADQVLHAVNELSSMRKNEQKIRACCKEIKRLEELADEIYENGIIRLFEGESNAVELLKVKEIIQELEKSVNKINSVRKVLKTIIVKYA